MNCERSFFKIITHVIVLLVAMHLTAFGQYYPAPKPVNPSQERGLLNHLKNSQSDSGKIRLLLDLCNLNFNKPLKKTVDLDRATVFAKEASQLSIKLGDQSGYNDAQLFIADLFTVKDNMKAAEDILPLVNDTSRINLLLNLSFKYWNLEKPKKEEDWQKALLFAEQARQLSIRYHLPGKEILALKDIAMVHADQGNASAEAELLEVVKRYKTIGYPYLHYTYYELAELNFYRGKPDKALNYILQTIKSMKATGDSVNAGDFYHLRGNISINNGDFQEGFYFYNLAINNYKIHAGRLSLAERKIFAEIPLALRKMKRYDEALRYVRKAMKAYPPLTSTDQTVYASIIGNIYRDMKAYDLAERYFIKASQFGKKQGGISYLNTYKDIGQVYVESGQYAKAKPYLNKYWKIFGNQMSSGAKSHMNYMLFLADSATGDYRSAIKHLSDYRGLEEFNLRQAQNKEVGRLEVQYGVKEKENALKIKDQHIALLNQNHKLEEIKLKQFKLEKDVTIGGILVLLTITGLLYKQYRDKKRTNLAITKKSEEISSKNDIISQKNEHLELLLQEKEWLIKEVHHRVKNNLHTVISLLEAQSAYLENDALKAIENSRNRIYTMSLIHQKLYQSDDVKTIDMAIYIPEMIQYLSDSFDTGNKIHFRLKIDPLNLDVAYAIPLALIINEAVTNSIKYAFPGKQKGEISISLEDQGGTVKLELADNGIGMDPNITETELDSLGLDLMKGLSKDINADISFDTRQGTTIIIIFKLEYLYYHDNLLAPQGLMET
jgi:two-component sensor histidine kinase